MTLRGDKTKCSICGGGVWYGEHYAGCPNTHRSKVKPSKSGYGVFLFSEPNRGFVVRAIDGLANPYRVDSAIKIYKRKADAERYCDGLNDGTILL